MPAAGALIALGAAGGAVLFERGAFGPTDSVNGLACASSPSRRASPPSCLIRVLQPGFFSRKDTKTPTWFAFVSLIVNIVLALALFPTLKPCRHRARHLDRRLGERRAGHHLPRPPRPFHHQRGGAAAGGDDSAADAGDVRRALRPRAAARAGVRPRVLLPGCRRWRCWRSACSARGSTSRWRTSPGCNGWVGCRGGWAARPWRSSTCPPRWPAERPTLGRRGLEMLVRSVHPPPQEGTGWVSPTPTPSDLLVHHHHQRPRR